MIKEWIEYYKYLEMIREMGIVNMYGATPYLVRNFTELDETTGRKVLASWMDNYSEIIKEIGNEQNR